MKWFLLLALTLLIVAGAAMFYILPDFEAPFHNDFTSPILALEHADYCSELRRMFASDDKARHQAQAIKEHSLIDVFFILGYVSLLWLLSKRILSGAALQTYLIGPMIILAGCADLAENYLLWQNGEVILQHLHCDNSLMPGDFARGKFMVLFLLSLIFSVKQLSGKASQIIFTLVSIFLMGVYLSRPIALPFIGNTDQLAIAWFISGLAITWLVIYARLLMSWLNNIVP